MLSPRPGYHRHSAKYKQALLQLQSKYASIKDIKEKKKLMDTFSDNYLMPMEYWLIRLRNENNVYREDFFDQHHRKALFHLCHDYHVQGYCTSDMIVYRQTKPAVYGGYDPKAALKYPNPRLRKTLMELKEDAMTPLSKETEKRVDEMEALYWKIKGKENDQEQWMKCLQEAGNFKFVKRNIEHRLSFNLCNKRLWKLYINYLEKVDPLEMLHVYSKYCRFFMDDDEMLEEYKQAVIKHGPVYVKWKNPFHFETQDVNEEYPDNVDPRDDDDPMPPDSDYIFEFDTFTAQRQEWSLPNPLIRYIRCNASSANLRKLNQTCKYFFTIQPQILCYQFSFDSTSPECSSTSLVMKDSIYISANSFLPIYQKNLHITTTFKMIHRNSKLLSKVIQKCIYKCTAEFITLYEQKLTEKEFKFLIGHGNVEKIELRNTVIKNDNNEDISLIEMLTLLPKIRSFDVDILFQSKTVPMLSELAFKNKFLKFNAAAFNYVFDPEDFRHFLKNNAAPFSYFRFKFGHQCSEEKVKELKKIAKRIFENQKNIDGKPELDIFYEL